MAQSVDAGAGRRRWIGTWFCWSKIGHAASEAVVSDERPTLSDWQEGDRVAVTLAFRS